MACVTASKWKYLLADRLVSASLGPEISTRRLVLRSLRPTDVFAWQEVRRRCAPWLLPWEPLRPPGSIDPTVSRAAFDARCEQRDRERALGTSYGFGIFEDGRVIGECNLNNVVRGAMQGASLGYWIDSDRAGQGFMPESVVGVLAYSFEVIGLHRVEINIVPRNAASRRVVQKLDLRDEGIAERFLEINGVWEDHVRYAMTSEEWTSRREALSASWLQPS
jgi:ribosomal-protein-alanine N-acetyltransferase